MKHRKVEDPFPIRFFGGDKVYTESRGYAFSGKEDLVFSWYMLGEHFKNVAVVKEEGTGVYHTIPVSLLKKKV